MMLTIAGAAANGAAMAERVTPANSSSAWIIAGKSAPVDLGRQYGEDCPEPMSNVRPIIYACATEYRFDYPNGEPGTRIFAIQGEVTWTNVHVNPLGPGALGTPHSSVGFRTSWIRYWHEDSRKCLAGYDIHGYIQSNFPCAAAQIWYGNPKSGAILGTDTAYWPWLYQYPCRRRGDWTTCSNKVGDAYRYRGSYPQRAA